MTVIAAQPPVPAALDGVVSEVLASHRYRWLAPEFVARLAGDAVRRTRRPADAVKETKRRLHQVFGAYVQDLDHKRMIDALESAASKGPDALRETARGLMSQHTSTRERLPALDRFYREVFAVTGPPHHVLDLACGLAPLGLPWMALPLDARYDTFDVDRRFVEIAHTCLRLFGVDGDAELRDVAGDPTSRPADVALLLKAMPCFEQQAPGSAARVLDAVHARWLVVSFPTRSLGGAGKGMVSHYRAMMEQMSAGRAWRVHELLLPVELVFVAEKATGAG